MKTRIAGLNISLRLPAVHSVLAAHSVLARTAFAGCPLAVFALVVTPRRRLGETNT
jgi:hypothetical protein